MTRTRTFDDALAAAAILREAGAGHEHEHAADVLATASGLGALDTSALEALRDVFSVEP